MILESIFMDAIERKGFRTIHLGYHHHHTDCGKAVYLSIDYDKCYILALTLVILKDLVNLVCRRGCVAVASVWVVFLSLFSGNVCRVLSYAGMGYDLI